MGIEKDGYLSPRDKIFEEIVGTCAKRWVKDFPGVKNWKYITDKIQFISHLKNEGADCIFALQQFHPVLRADVIRGLSDEAKDFIKYYDQVNENKNASSERDSK